MTKLLTLLLIGSLVSCDQEAQPNDVAARASGRYTVQSYVLNNDTLYTSTGVNKLGVSEFYIVVSRKGPDTVRVGSVYKKTGDAGAVIFIKDVGVKETKGAFQLSASLAVPSIYEGRIEGKVFYERAIRGGPAVLILPDFYLPKPVDNPALEGIIITAEQEAK